MALGSSPWHRGPLSSVLAVGVSLCYSDREIHVIQSPAVLSLFRVEPLGAGAITTGLGTVEDLSARRGTEIEELPQ